MKNKVPLYLLVLGFAFNSWASADDQPGQIAPGGARVLLRVELPGPRALPQIGEPVVVPRPTAWGNITAEILSQLYRQEYGMDLLNGHRIQSGKRFPIALVERASDWRQLVERCAEARKTSNLGPETIYTDVCFDIADQWSWISGDGKDSSNAGRQMRHIINQMGLGDQEGKAMFNKLGFPAKEKRVQQGFKSKIIIDFD